MKKAILGLIVAMVLISSAIAVQNSAQPDAPQKNVKTKDPKGTIDVIVTLKDVATDVNIDKVKQKIGDIKVNEKGWNEVYPNGFSAVMTKEQMKILSQDPMVERIDINEMQSPTLDTANQWSGTTKARSAPPAGYGVDGDRDGKPKNYSKTDVVVAVIDTGIDPKHKDLTGQDNGGTKKILAWKDTIAGILTPYDDMGHGTHVASIVAGEGDADPKYKGVAPGAALVAVKVCDIATGKCPMDKIITGINWVVANKATYGIKIAQMSIGGVGASDGTDPESKAFNNAVSKGLVVTLSAGNSGPTKYTIGRPAAAASAITVGAIADPGYITGTLKTGLVDNGFYLAPFSSRGPTADNRIKPDIVAPGVSIMADKNTYPNTATYHGGYVEMDGTSMAAPFVAGVVALMFDANYSLTPAKVKSMIRATAEDYGVAGCDIDYGCGRIRAYKAIGYAKTGAIPVADQTVPTHKRYQSYINDTTDAKSYPVTITSTSYPYASTLIMTDWSGISSYYGDAGIDLDLFKYNPANVVVGSSEDIERQESLVVRPITTGVFRDEVSKWLGSGFYTLDISYK